MKTPHKWHECNCGECYTCKSELTYCEVCGGFEGTLTTDCCGRMLTKEEEFRIYNEGSLDFRDGEWAVLPNYTRVHSGQGENTKLKCVDGKVRTIESYKAWMKDLKLDDQTCTEEDVIRALGGKSSES